MIAVESDNILAASTILWAAEQTLGPAYTSFLNDASSSGNTAVILASKYGNESILRLLLEEGATVLPANRRGQAAVHVAAHRGHTACLELILDAPIRTTIHSGATRIAAMASVHDYAGECRYIDSHDKAGFTALHLAAITRSSLAVSALVERGATLDSPVLRGMERLPFLCGGSTPLHIAAAQGDARTCLILLDGQWRHPGLELRRVRNMLGLTPLNCALLGGHHDVVRILLDPGSRTTRGRRGGRGGAAAANGLGGPLTGPAATSLFRMVPMNASFPESLREHMLAVLQRAALLLQLREIAGEWRAEGAAQPSDSSIVSDMPLLTLNLDQIYKLQSLLRRPETSLKDFLCGLESSLHGGGTAGRRRRRRVRRREREALANAEVSESTQTTPTPIPAAAAEAAEIATIVDSPSSSDGEEEEEDGEGQQRNALELALHEISGSAVPATNSTVNGNNNISGAVAGSASSPHASAEGHSGTEEVGEKKKGSSTNTTPPGPSSFPAVPAVVLDEDCSICMDSKPEIAFLPCSHSLCFHCACRLCSRGTDAATCPFCRRAVESVTALTGARSSSSLKKEKRNTSASDVATSTAATATVVVSSEQQV